jgi:hypothetical protein
MLWEWRKSYCGWRLTINKVRSGKETKTVARIKQSKRVLEAIKDHQKSTRGIQVAKQRVDDFTRHLFTALKDQEAALMRYNKTSHRLHKLQSGS